VTAHLYLSAGNSEKSPLLHRLIAEKFIVEQLQKIPNNILAHEGRKQLDDKSCSIHASR
jgi:hypothetical protein